MTKSKVCKSHDAIGIYSFDSYGYNSIYVNAIEYGIDDYVYFTFCQTDIVNNTTKVSYHKRMIKSDNKGNLYFSFYRRIYFDKIMRF